MVLLHELGHCFHFYLGKSLKPYALLDWTPEVGETGSMSMEYMGLEQMNQYLDQDTCNRVKEDHLLKVVRLFITCSQGDEFQHWLYDNPGHTPQMRRDKWKKLNNEYSIGVEFDGYEEVLSKVSWQFMHILLRPFYLIDYCISELVAMTIWDRYKKDPSDALAHYKRGCSLGGSKTVSDTFNTFGTQLNFGEEVIEPLAKNLASELELL